MKEFDNVKLEKGMYRLSDKTFSQALEDQDPSDRYENTPYAGLDAYQRQLKRFDIKVTGQSSDKIEKFFRTTDSAALFPEYVSRAIRQGMTESTILPRLTAAMTKIDSMEYRSITCDQDESYANYGQILEGTFIPQTKISLNETPVQLAKRGRMLVASYEAIKFQKLDVFTVTLKQIGAYIAKAQLKDAADTLTGAGATAAAVLETKLSGVVSADDLISLWGAFSDFDLNTILASPVMAAKIIAVCSPAGGSDRDFFLTGSAVKPMGAALLKSDALDNNTAVALDKRFALEMVSAGDVTVDYDKLIDCQFEKATVTSIAGFAKIFPAAVKVLKLKA